MLNKSNLYSKDITYLETKRDEMMNRIEKRGVEQAEEQKDLLERLGALREEIDEWEAIDQKVRLGIDIWPYIIWIYIYVCIG